MELLITKSEASWLSAQCQIFDFMQASDKPTKVKLTHSGKRSLSQNAFMHVMFGEISIYLINKGRKDCSPAWVKVMLKNRFLGWGYQTFTDIITGEKVKREVLRSSSKLSPGEAMDFITQILDWADSIGCEIKIPEQSEYMELMRGQNQ